jgi:hypothetical protein
MPTMRQFRHFPILSSKSPVLRINRDSTEEAFTFGMRVTQLCVNDRQQGSFVPIDVICPLMIFNMVWPSVADCRLKFMRIDTTTRA